jgi:putative ABC transport system ATP-binding protein
MEPILRVKKLTKSYKADTVETPALRGVDLEIYPGEFTAIVGPSGSGKSTLLHILGGLDKPNSGEVWLQDRRVDQLSSTELASLRLRHLGFVFQAYNLIPVLTTLENAAFVLELQGMNRHEREHKAMEALKELGIDELAKRRPNQLSGGQQQRVAVARAIAGEPKLVLADEPTANLDSKTGLTLIDLMKHLNLVHGVTFLFSTHDPRLLEHVRRIVRLEDGRVVGEELVENNLKLPRENEAMLSVNQL